MDYWSTISFIVIYEHTRLFGLSEYGEYGVAEVEEVAPEGFDSVPRFNQCSPFNDLPALEYIPSDFKLVFSTIGSLKLDVS